MQIGNDHLDRFLSQRSGDSSASIHSMPIPFTGFLFLTFTLQKIYFEYIKAQEGDTKEAMNINVAMRNGPQE